MSIWKIAVGTVLGLMLYAVTRYMVIVLSTLMALFVGVVAVTVAEEERIHG